ncbi:MAG: hypothetical protein ABEI31_08350 [Halodesulfurarchaeum sp.]
MSLKWRQDLPADWEDVPDDPPESESDFVIEPLDDGVVMLPLTASIDRANANVYLYCDDRHVASLGEEGA